MGIFEIDPVFVLIDFAFLGIEFEFHLVRKCAETIIKSEVFLTYGCGPKEPARSLGWERGRPYTKEDAQAVEQFWPRDPSIRKLMIAKLQERLQAICEAVPPQRLVGQIMRLNALFEEHARESGLKVDLEQTGTSNDI